MLTARRIRSIIEKHPLQDKSLQNVLEQWMIDLAEEIVENIKNEQSHLATKDDIKQVIEMMNARFEAMEKANAARFELVMKENIALRQEMNARFEAIDKRFEAMEKANAARFEAINQRFESLEKRLAFMQWLIGGGVLLVALKLFFPHIFPH
jgi:flagellar biosynthesis/type III secretory pathway chaperone